MSRNSRSIWWHVHRARHRLAWLVVMNAGFYLLVLHSKVKTQIWDLWILILFIYPLVAGWIIVSMVTQTEYYDKEGVKEFLAEWEKRRQDPGP